MNENGNVSMKNDWPAWLLIILMFGLGIALWSSSPEQMPVHWNWKGVPDGMGGKFEGLLAIPLLTLAIYLLMVFLPRIDPGRANYRLFSGPYIVMRLAIIAVMAAIYFIMLAAQRKPDLNIVAFVPLLIGMMFVVFGNLMGKLRPNWFVGIRTPWTLTSKLSWTRTHRAGGIGMVVLGLVLMPLGFLKTEASFWILIIGVFGWVLFLLVYSYFIWRIDPDRVPPAGSGPADGV
ncbi:MAG: SdpI family protein [bacterium]